jgi:predicted nucleic acid-binding protein
MTILVDTNVLLRLSVSAHPMHGASRNAIVKLQANGERLVIVPQNIYEYWVVATRPLAQNGMGRST